MEIFFVLLGIIAGIASGMFGIGGGVVIVPVLMLLFQFNQVQANGTSLAALLMPVGIFAVIQYHRAGKLKIKIAVPVAIGLIGGAYFGAEMAQSLPSTLLQQLYGVFLLYAGWRFAEPRKWIAEYRSKTAPSASPAPEAIVQVAWWKLLILGIFAGVLSGMFGIGGGIVIVPALVTFLKFDQKLAVGTSLGALLFPVGLGGVISYYNKGALELGTAALVALGLVIGAFAGARVALQLPEKTIKRLYGLFLFVIALKFIFLPS